MELTDGKMKNYTNETSKRSSEYNKHPYQKQNLNKQQKQQMWNIYNNDKDNLNDKKIKCRHKNIGGVVKEREDTKEDEKEITSLQAIKDDCAPSNKMINFYKLIPKKFLNNVPNPQYNQHLIKTMFRMCVCAPSGSGKTNFIMNLLQRFSSGDGTFAKIYIITKDSEPLYDHLQTTSDNIFVIYGLDNVPNLEKDFDKTDGTQSIVIFDDLVLAKNQKAIENYYMKARKSNVNCVYISQSYHAIPIFIRKNSTHLVILRLGGLREVNRILSEYGLGVTKDQLLGMYEYATEDKFDCLVIANEEQCDSKFRKNFLDILNPNNFMNIAKEKILYNHKYI